MADDQPWRELTCCLKDIAESLREEIGGHTDDNLKRETRRASERSRDALLELQRFAEDQSTAPSSGQDWRECLTCMRRGARALTDLAISEEKSKSETLKDHGLEAKDVANQITNLHRDLMELLGHSEKAPPTAAERAEKAALEAKAAAEAAKKAAQEAKATVEAAKKAAKAEAVETAAQEAKAATEIAGGKS